MTARDEIIALDKRFVWHPYTAMKAWIDDGDPLVIARAEGTHIWDVDGRRYIDASASWWVAPLGHRHPRLIAAMKRQADTLCHVSFGGITHEPGARLAAELCAIAPGDLCRVFYSDDGSTAVETALELALGYWFHLGQAKRRFVALAGGFHGDTLGAASLCGVDAFVAGTDGTGVETTFVPLPPATRDDPAFDAAVRALETALRPGDVAALVVEPIVQGAAGMRIYAPAYLAEARRLCDAHGALLIVDEVFTGYGRSGSMWACEHAAVVPDLMCIAKGFTAGVLPMAATLARQHVFDAFCGDKARAFYHGHTYSGHPLGAAVAREVLAIYRDEDIIARTLPKAARIRDAFARFGDIDGVSATRSIGMIGALELAPAGVAGYLADDGWQVYAEARARGAYLRPLGNVIYITPPLNIGDDDLDELLSIVEASLSAVSSRRS